MPAAKSAEPIQHGTLALWHLLSLDAPSVAATWTLFIAWSAGVKLSILDPLAMFLAVWMLYAADRLLDARSLFVDPLAPDLEERHHFHHRHRCVFLPLLVGGTMPLVWLLHRLDPAVLHLYTLLAVVMAGWLLLVHAHASPAAPGRRLPKEIAVGIFFAAAVFIATVARAPALRGLLAPMAALFGGVCSLNCLLLYAWEHPHDHSRAHASTRFAVRHLRPLATTLGALCLALVAWSGIPRGTIRTAHHALAHPAAIPLCCASSLALLVWLDRNRRRFAPVRLRAMADLVLLPPLLPLTLAAVGLLR